jgi:hypothetical protein
MAKQIHYKASDHIDHISPTTAEDPYFRPALSLLLRLWRQSSRVVSTPPMARSTRPAFTVKAPPTADTDRLSTRCRSAL